jgi:hypothetical protein
LSDYFLDASALVKRYSTETGSNWITQLTDPAAQNTILIAEITVVEWPLLWQPSIVQFLASHSSKKTAL